MYKQELERVLYSAYDRSSSLTTLTLTEYTFHKETGSSWTAGHLTAYTEGLGSMDRVGY